MMKLRPSLHSRLEMEKVCAKIKTKLHRETSTEKTKNILTQIKIEEYGEKIREKTIPENKKVKEKTAYLLVFPSVDGSCVEARRSLEANHYKREKKRK